MEPKPVRASSLVMAHQTLPQDANPAGNVHGGVIMRHIDTAGGVVAIRHARGNAVTASVDRLDFLAPVFVGDLVIVKASLNMVGKTSMEAGVRVEAENLFTGDVRHCASAYITYVALDKKGKPTEIPELILETEEEKRRNTEAQARRTMRQAERMREKTI
jgi:uncharacterized protein (TIGR00369 family)